MDMYDRAMAYLFHLDAIQQWPDAQTLLKRASARKPYAWQLPVIACEAVGGDASQSLPGMVATGCLQVSIILIDDMLDADPKGEHQRIGQPATANLAAALQSIGLEAIAHSTTKSEIKLPILRRLNQMVFTTALGQSWDVQNPHDEDTYWQVVRTKSAPFFGTALYMGGLLGGATEDTAAQLDQLGCLYGEMIQIHDDLSDAMACPANPDWTLQRSPLPLLFAEIVHHPDRERFLELRRAITCPDALAEAQSILIRCGAISYAVDQLLRRFLTSQKILTTMSLVGQDRLEVLLHSVINPVQELLTMMGVAQPNDALTSLILPSLDPPA
jgi:geranylgeranyl pyrophosphate synthase